MKKMKRIFGIFIIFLASAIIISSCQKFSVLNTDPNNISPSIANPNFLMAQVLTSSAMFYGNLGSGDISGAMQQTCQDAWSSGYSNYDWGTKDWSTSYGILRDNKLMLEKAQANGWKFHQGVGLIMRAFNFGVIADFWGDAPFSMALNGDQSGISNQQPVFDSQDKIYDGVIADLQAALPLLTGSTADYPELNTASDVFYGGDPAKWTKLANTLMLRYYLRLSAKRDVKTQVEALVSKVFTSNDDDFAMSYPGTDQNTSYPKNSKYNDRSNYDRNKMSATLVKKLDDLKDPRLVIMAQPIKTSTVIDASKFPPGDVTTISVMQGGVRYINPAAAAATKIKQFNITTYATDRPWQAPISSVYSFFDTMAVYVGVPISYASETYQYNLNAVGTQANSNNDFVSYLRKDIYDQPKGDLLKARMASYTEVCFDLAEAAQKGWNTGQSADYWYYKGIQSSFDLWEVFANYQGDVNSYFNCVKNYNDYIAQPKVAYDGTLARIIEQKWIASWQASNESFLDWRRTGFPDIHIGWASVRGQIPVRFAYFNTELQNNPTNANAAISKLQATPYSGADGQNSSWSKFWLLQGTTAPW